MDPAREVLWACKRIVAEGLVSGTWGNVSTLRDGKVWITPSGVPYDTLSEEDIVVVELATGKKVQGKHNPSSELPLHLTIYRKLPRVRAIVHTHSTYVLAFAVAEKDVPCFTEEQAQIIGGRIRVAKYAEPGTWELAENVVEALEDKFAVLLSRHGAVSVGRSMPEAVIVAEVVEKSAKVAFSAKLLGSPRELSPGEISSLRKKYLESYSRAIHKSI